MSFTYPEILTAGVDAGGINKRLTNGDPIRLGQGNFYLEEPIVVRSYSDFRGMGRFLTKLIAVNSTTHMIKSNTVDVSLGTVHVKLADFSLNGRGYATKAIELGNASNYYAQEMRIENINIKNCASGIIANSFVYSSISDVLILGTNTASSFGVKFGNLTQECLCTNLVTAGFGYNWWITSVGVHMIKCVSYAEVGHTNTVNLLLIQDGHNHKFDDCLFEYLGTGAIDEVLLEGVNNHCPDNKFLDNYWCGTGRNSTNLKIGVAGGLAVYQTTVENGRFMDSSSKTNVNLANQSNTNLLRNKRVSGYSGYVPYDLILAGQDITATGGKQVKFNE